MSSTYSPVGVLIHDNEYVSFEQYVDTSPNEYLVARRADAPYVVPKQHVGGGVRLGTDYNAQHLSDNGCR